MRRWEFISILSCAVIALPRAATAQDSVKRPLVAVLLGSPSTAAARYVSGLPQGLQELGYVEGRNIDIVYRYADGDMARMPALADKLVRLKPNMIVTGSSAAILAFQRATATIPIVRTAA
jgi:putative ABC transport system substrate-binding protein